MIAQGIMGSQPEIYYNLLFHCFTESYALKALIPFTPGSFPVQPQSHLRSLISSSGVVGVKGTLVMLTIIWWPPYNNSDSLEFMGPLLENQILKIDLIWKQNSGGKTCVHTCHVINLQYKIFWTYVSKSVLQKHCRNNQWHFHKIWT